MRRLLAFVSFLGLALATPWARPSGPQEKAGAKPAPAQETPTWAQEADRVVAEAEARARLEENARRRVDEHFLLCDLDGNGWISFREGQVTLGLERPQFQNYDLNWDGRINREEFAQRDEALLTLLGAVPTPKKARPERPNAVKAELPPEADSPRPRRR